MGISWRGSSFDEVLNDLLRAWQLRPPGSERDQLVCDLEPALRAYLASESVRIADRIAKLPDRVIERVPELVRAAVTALDANTEPHQLFHDLKRRLARESKTPV